MNKEAYNEMFRDKVIIWLRYSYLGNGFIKPKENVENDSSKHITHED
jgi:hypothetical protein